MAYKEMKDNIFKGYFILVLYLEFSGNVYFASLPSTVLSNLIHIATLTLKRVTS